MHPRATTSIAKETDRTGEAKDMKSRPNISWRRLTDAPGSFESTTTHLIKRNVSKIAGTISMDTSLNAYSEGVSALAWSEA
jgi:hypothetical protein